MKADGHPGRELAFEYPIVLDDPAKGLKNLPFLSPENARRRQTTRNPKPQARSAHRCDSLLRLPYGGPHITLAKPPPISARDSHRSRRRYYNRRSNPRGGQVGLGPQRNPLRHQWPAKTRRGRFHPLRSACHFRGPTPAPAPDAAAISARPPSTGFQPPRSPSRSPATDNRGALHTPRTAVFFSKVTLARWSSAAAVDAEGWYSTLTPMKPSPAPR